MKNFNEELLSYGCVVADIETEEKDGYRRIRVIRLGEIRYFHHMFNGEVIECFEV